MLLTPRAMRQSLKERPRILDGGLSTALEERGHTLNGLLWTGELLRTAPAEIAEAHKAYVDAGAQDIIPLDNLTSQFNGAEQRFRPKFLDPDEPMTSHEVYGRDQVQFLQAGEPA